MGYKEIVQEEFEVARLYARKSAEITPEISEIREDGNYVESLPTVDMDAIKSRVIGEDLTEVDEAVIRAHEKLMGSYLFESSAYREMGRSLRWNDMFNPSEFGATVARNRDAKAFVRRCFGGQM